MTVSKFQFLLLICHCGVFLEERSYHDLETVSLKKTGPAKVTFKALLVLDVRYMTRPV